MPRTRILLFAAMILLVASAASAASIATINGSPLRINVGSDGSFQVYNSSVPGIGQIYPTTTSLADMGVFAWIDGTLYAPDFPSHGTTATGAGLTAYTKWREVSLTSTPTGEGTSASPYSVSVVLGAGDTDVRVNMNVTYVRGNNFFRMRTQFYSVTNKTHEIDAIIGADIYLASSDNGLFVTVPELAAVGGRNCEGTGGSYNILLIPITPAGRFTTAQFADVWRQIQANTLDNNSESIGCVDNGAAVEWQDIMSQSTSVELNTAVSFGEIPSVANFHGFVLSVTPDVLTLSPGGSAKVTVTSRHNEELGFNAPIHFTAPSLPPGMSVTFDQQDVPAPGDGSISATVKLDSTVFPQFYRNVGIYGSGGTETHGAFFGVDVLCMPPFILGINQPQSKTVHRGDKAKLEVRPEGGGAFSYQWYAGHAPMIGTPMPSSNSWQFETPAVTETQQYWVRITNACGSVNSTTATVIPTD